MYVGLAPQDSNAGSAQREREKGGDFSLPPVIVLQTQRPFDSFVWTHTFMSNCCISFLVYPTRRTRIKQDRQRIWHRHSSETTLNSSAQGQRLPFACRAAGSGLWPSKRHSLSMEINTAVIITEVNVRFNINEEEPWKYTLHHNKPRGHAFSLKNAILFFKQNKKTRKYEIKPIWQKKLDLFMKCK